MLKYLTVSSKISTKTNSTTLTIGSDDYPVIIKL